MVSHLTHILTSLSGFFLSPICVTCGNKIEGFTGYICDSCREKLLSFGLQKVIRPEKVGSSTFYYLYPYKPHNGVDLGGAVRTLKYNGHWRLAEELAKLLFQSGQKRGLFDKTDIITAIPLHPARQRERGFNQSELIACRLGKIAGIPFGNLLQRKRNTAQQAELSALSRELNVKGAFTVLDTVDLTNKRIILLDDQITTGETLDNAGVVLITQGAASVTGLSLTH